MKLHRNAALSLKGRRELCRRVVEGKRTASEAAAAAEVSVAAHEKSWRSTTSAEGARDHLRRQLGAHPDDPLKQFDAALHQWFGGAAPLSLSDAPSLEIAPASRTDCFQRWCLQPDRWQLALLSAAGGRLRALASADDCRRRNRARTPRRTGDPERDRCALRSDGR